MSRIKDENRTIEDFKKLPIIGKQPESDKEEAFLREVCEFEFFNIEEPGVSVRFPYGNSKNHHNFTLFHGGKYKLPRFLARHIESRSTPMWDWRPDGTGKLIKKKIGDNPRFQMRQIFGG